MGGQRVTRVICAADARGSGEAVERLLEATVERNAHVVSLVGDLSDGHGSPEGYRAVFRALGAGALAPDGHLVFAGLGAHLTRVLKRGAQL